MGISEIITAIGAVGISSLILALVKLFSFFKDANKEKVSDILTRVDDDNKKWYSRYNEASEELQKKNKEAMRLSLLNHQLRIELMKSGVPEARLDEIEKEMDEDA